MKLKKLFAGIVAVAMMATMGATSVFATEKAPVVPTAPTDKQVSIKKVITGNGYGSETVKLEVDESGRAVLVKHSSYTTANAPTISVVETAGVTITAPTAPVTTAEGTLHIQLPNYDRVGTYVYKFHEVAGATAGMTYDSNSKWLLVNVYNDVNSDGEFADGSDLKVNAVVLNADPTNALNAKNRDGLSALKIDHIDNKYDAGTYTVKKLVKGNMSDRQKDFNFQVTFEKAKNATIPGIKLDSDTLNLEWKDVTSDSGVEKQTATYKFTLKHGGEKKFENIPYGVKVSVVELTDSEAPLTKTDGKLTNGEYEVTYQNNSNAVTEINKEKANVTATIINASTVNVNTGVILDNAPYIALLTIVAAGAVVMIMKKRRNYED